MNSRRTLWAGSLLIAAVLMNSAQAQHVLAVRVASLDRLLSDVDAVAQAVGQPPGSGEGLLMMGAMMFGLPGIDWIDRSRPIAITVPTNGMMLGNQGVVATVPVADTADAIETLKMGAADAEVDAQGVLRLPMAPGQNLLFFPNDGYLRVGFVENLVSGADPAEVLAGDALPDGSLAIEVDLEPVRPMIEMGLQAARQQAMMNPAMQGNEALLATSMMPIDWMESLMANTQRLQVAVSVFDGHLIWRQHVLPVVGSALHDFLAVQESEMPAYARAFDRDDADALVVSNVRLTDAANAFFLQFFEGMKRAMQVAGEQAPESASFAETIVNFIDWNTSLLPCFRGDSVQSSQMAQTMRFLTISGLREAPECASIVERIGGGLALIPEQAQGMVTFTDKAWEHRGVPVSEIVVDAKAFSQWYGTMLQSMMQMSPEGAKLDADIANEVSAMLFGNADRLRLSLARVDDKLIAAGDGGGDASVLTTVIDRLRGEASMGEGITPDAFAPFSFGAGVYGVIDYGKFVSFPTDVAEDADPFTREMAMVGELYRALGPVTGVLGLGDDRMALASAIRLEGLSAVVEWFQKSVASMTPPVTE